MRHLPAVKYGSLSDSGSSSEAMCAMIVLLCCLFCSTALAKNTPEYALKAAFLIHFIDFTKWPNSNSGDRTICVLGNNPFNEDLQFQTNAGRKHQDIRVKFTASLSETRGCHILFIARSEEAQLYQILTELANKPILTVSDIEGFANNKGMVEFVTELDTIKLVINLNSVNLSKLKLSSNLIDLAHVVEEPTAQGFAK